MLLPRGPDLGEPRGPSWGPPSCPGPLTPQSTPAPGAAVRPWEQSPARDPVQVSRSGQNGSGMLWVRTSLPTALLPWAHRHYMAWHSTARDTGTPTPCPGELLPGKHMLDAHTCCAHSLSPAWHGMAWRRMAWRGTAQRGTALGRDLLRPGEDAPAPRETLAQPRQAALMPGIIPQPGTVPCSHAPHGLAACPTSGMPPGRAPRH